MALKSMTGFGAASAKANGIVVRVELGSVNRKQLDVSLRLPPSLAALEAAAQNMVKETISRGRVSGTVQVESSATAGNLSLDVETAETAIQQLRAVAKRLKLEDRLDANALLQIPALFQNMSVALEPEAVFQPLERALRMAIKKLDAMRSQEGRALEADLRERLRSLEAELAAIRSLAPQVVSKVRKKLFQGLESCGIEDVEKDDRILKEIALFGERADISEEITRLKSHIQQFRQLMRAREPSGRPLDFLAQEMFREINTIGSKANDLDITQRVVAFKAELERIREQVQNVE